MRRFRHKFYRSNDERRARKACARPLCSICFKYRRPRLPQNQPIPTRVVDRGHDILHHFVCVILNVTACHLGNLSVTRFLLHSKRVVCRPSVREESAAALGNLVFYNDETNAGNQASSRLSSPQAGSRLGSRSC